MNKTKKRDYSRNKSPNYVAEKQISNICINNKRNKQTNKQKPVGGVLYVYNQPDLHENKRNLGLTQTMVLRLLALSTKKKFQMKGLAKLKMA